MVDVVVVDVVVGAAVVVDVGAVVVVVIDSGDVASTVTNTSSSAGSVVVDDAVVVEALAVVAADVGIAGGSVDTVVEGDDGTGVGSSASFLRLMSGRVRLMRSSISSLKLSRS